MGTGKNRKKGPKKAKKINGKSRENQKTREKATFLKRKAQSTR